MQVNATDNPAELGLQDHIFVALKAHSIPSVVTAVDGVPYWGLTQHR